MNEIDRFVDTLTRKVDGIRQAQLRFAVCKTVDWGDKTMSAVGVSDDVPYEGVQLGFGFADIKPAAGSVCLIGVLEGKEALTFLINAECVERMEITVKNETKITLGKVEIEASPAGLLSVKNGKYSLRTAFDDLLTAINALTVTTGTGPSGTPINFAQFDAVKSNLNNFLK
jgi:hypothetical protein